MRGLGIQAEVLVSLAVVMVTATGLLGAFVFETQSAQLERLGPLLAGALTDEARTASLAYEGGVSGATWFVVSEDASGNERVRGVGAANGVLSPAGLALAARAREQGIALLRTGKPWEPIRFAVPLEGPATGEVAVAILPRSVARWAVLAILLGDSLVFTLLGAYLLRGRVVLPLRRLAAAARSIGEGGAGARVQVEGTAEAAEVGHAFNEMSEALERRGSALEKAVTDLRGANASLRRARDGLDRAERLAAVGHLAAGVAHEVGNPMGALLAFLDLLARDENLSEGSRSYLERAAVQGERVRSILRQLLDFSRPPRSTPTSVNLCSAAEQAVGLVRAQRRYSQIRFEVEAPEDLPPVLADESQVSQILLNLVLNAADAVVDAEAPEIRLTLRAAPLRVRAGEDPAAARERASHDSVECCVEDNGPGIAEEDRTRIFDPFFTTKPPGQGTGLGLANALRLAGDLGGGLECTTSRVLGGAAFALRLPTVPGDGAADARTRTASSYLPTEAGGAPKSTSRSKV